MTSHQIEKSFDEYRNESAGRDFADTEAKNR